MLVAPDHMAHHDGVHRYTAQCLRLLVEYLVRSAGAVVSQAATALRGSSSGGTTHSSAVESLDAATGAMPIVLALMSSTLFQQQVRT